MRFRATDLRKDIYRILDQILETGRSIDIERKGKLLKISPVISSSRTQRLTPIKDLIVGDPARLEHIDWSSEWRP